MDIKAVIFDMDGLLIDSEDHWDDCSIKLLAARGVALTPELKSYVSGRSLRENMTWFKEQYGWEETVEALMREFRLATDHIYYELAKPLPGAESLIKDSRAMFPKQAIASGSFLYRIEKITERLAWKSYFDELVSSDHVNFVGKPDPIIYHFTADALRVLPEHCVVFEDSINGVQAAKAAGMQCVAVPNPRSHGDFSIADLIVGSLEDERIKGFLKIE